MIPEPKFKIGDVVQHVTEQGHVLMVGKVIRAYYSESTTYNPDGTFTTTPAEWRYSVDGGFVSFGSVAVATTMNPIDERKLRLKAE